MFLQVILASRLFSSVIHMNEIDRPVFERIASHLPTRNVARLSAVSRRHSATARELVADRVRATSRSVDAVFESSVRNLANALRRLLRGRARVVRGTVFGRNEFSLEKFVDLFSSGTPVVFVRWLLPSGEQMRGDFASLTREADGTFRVGRTLRFVVGSSDPPPAAYRMQERLHAALWRRAVDAYHSRA